MSVNKVASWLFLAGMAPMIIKYKHIRRAIAFTSQKFIGQNSLEFAAEGIRIETRKEMWQARRAGPEDRKEDQLQIEEWRWTARRSCIFTWTARAELVLIFWLVS